MDRNSLNPTNSIHTLFVILHEKLVQIGFQCIVESPSTVPGFEPSIRGIDGKVNIFR
jgi:hypothetical protein